MKFFFAFVLFLAAICFADAKKKDTVTAVQVTGSTYRAISITTFPTVKPRLLEILAIAAERVTNQEQVDAIGFLITNINQSSLLFAYYHAQGDVPSGNGNSSGIQNGQASAFAFALRTFAVFEYDDRDGIQGFNPGGLDLLTGWYDLSHVNVTWKDFNITSATITQGSTTFQYHTIEMQTMDNVFLLRFHVATVPVQIGQTVITPNSIKIDLELQWFNNPLNVKTSYSTGQSNAAAFPNARTGVIAFTAAAAGTVTYSKQAGNTNSQVSIVAGNVNGYFNWSNSANTVAANGVQSSGVIAVEYQNATISAQATLSWVVSLFTFTFDVVRPTNVEWDPLMGADIKYAGGASTIVVPFAFLLVALLALLN